jgi:hypothetical protein
MAKAQAYGLHRRPAFKSDCRKSNISESRSTCRLGTFPVVRTTSLDAWQEPIGSCRGAANLSNQTTALVNLFTKEWNVSNEGRPIALAVSHLLPTAAARVRAHVRSCGEQSGTAAGFLRVLQFPLPILIPPTPPYSSSIIWGSYNRPISGRRTKWTHSHPTPKNLKKKSKEIVH